MAFKIFCAWQSDRPNHLCRGMIRKALEEAARLLGADPHIQEAMRDGIVIDQDTQGVSGSPSIADTIVRKIESSDAFIADLTLTHVLPADEPGEEPRKRAPNPNVMLEYGCALVALGDEKIIGVMSKSFGKPRS